MGRVFLMARNHGSFGRVKLHGSILYLDGRAYSKNNICALPKWLWPEEIATIEITTQWYSTQRIAHTVITTNRPSLWRAKASQRWKHI